MTILPSSSLPVASSPAVVAGGNAAADNQSPDSFGLLVAQLSGGLVPSAPSRGRVTRAKDDQTDPVQDDHSAAADPDDQTLVATALPAWLWVVNEPAQNLPLPSSSEKPAGDSPNDSATQIDAASSAVAAMPATDAVGNLTAVVFPTLQPLADASAAGSEEAAAPSPLSARQAAAAPTNGLESALPGAAADVAPAPTVVATPSPASTPTGNQPVAPTGTTTAAPDSFSSTLEQSASASAPPVARGAAANPGTPSAKSPAAGVAENPVAPSAAPSVGGSSTAVAPPVPTSPIEKARAAAKAALDNALRGRDAAAASDTRPAATVATAPPSAQPTTAARDQSRQESASSFAEAGKQAALDTLQNATAPGAAADAGVHFEHSAALSSGQGLALGHEASIDKTLAAAVPVMAESVTRGAAIDDASLHKQMVQAIQLQTRQGGGEATLTLQPEYLGDVTIALRVEQGVVTAHVSAATSEVRTWLTANESVLREGLRDQGLTLERLVVSDEPASDLRKDGQPRRERDQAPPEEQPRQRPRRETGTFEITV